jgi:hypothetical protein
MIPAQSSLGKAMAGETLFLSVVDDFRDRTRHSAVQILFALYALIDFFAVYRDVLGGIDPDAHLVALDAQYGDRHFVADHHGLTNASRQYQHICAPIFLGNYSGALTAWYRIAGALVHANAGSNRHENLIADLRIQEYQMHLLHLDNRINKAFN